MLRMAPARDALLAQVRRGTLEFCVLALLRDREEYAFELVRSLGAVEALATSEGTIYPLLARLRRDGLVSSSWRESPTGPPRRYYQLTPPARRPWPPSAASGCSSVTPSTR
jgi:PadR family transcriptional regulator PadR